MTDRELEKRAFGFVLFTLVAFAALIGAGFVTGGAGSQELFETFRPPAVYAESLRAAGPALRATLFLDLFFMIGYGGGVALLAAANRRRGPVMAWVAGIGIGLVVGLDIAENLVMLSALDLSEAGVALEPGRVAWQAGVSGAKWFTAALSVVALTTVLPRDTVLDKLLIWLARIAMPLGTGLFVTGAFGLRELGGVLILAGMGGGFALFALTIWQRLRA